MDQFSCGIGAGHVENFSSTKILGVPAQGGYAQLQIDLRKVAPDSSRLQRRIRRNHEKQQEVHQL